MTTDTKIKDEQALIVQSSTSVVVLPSDQIVRVIEDLHACYDYCAAWNDLAQEAEEAQPQKDQPEQKEHRANLNEILR